jgi:kinesin family protein 5
MLQIQDLLAPENTNLQIREDKYNGMYVENLSEHNVRCLNDVLVLLDYGGRARQVAHTKVNRQSSRSHTVFMINVTKRSKKMTESSRALAAKFIICDLAGSERAHRTQPEGIQFEEAKFINKSLSALGNVISALSSSSTATHIPWRDSKLTRLLQDTLGSNSRTSLIVNISPEPSSYHESITSLLFGQRAMTVRVKPKVNEKEINYRNLANELQVCFKLQQLILFRKS